MSDVENQMRAALENLLRAAKRLNESKPVRNLDEIFAFAESTLVASSRASEGAETRLGVCGNTAHTELGRHDERPDCYRWELYYWEPMARAHSEGVDGKDRCSDPSPHSPHIMGWNDKECPGIPAPPKEPTR